MNSLQKLLKALHVHKLILLCKWHFSRNTHIWCSLTVTLLVLSRRDRGNRLRNLTTSSSPTNVISMASLRCIFGALSLLWDSYESFPFCNTTTFFGNRCFKPDLFPLGMNTSYNQAETRCMCNESEKFS